MLIAGIRADFLRAARHDGQRVAAAMVAGGRLDVDFASDLAVYKEVSPRRQTPRMDRLAVDCPPARAGGDRHRGGSGRSTGQQRLAVAPGEPEQGGASGLHRLVEGEALDGLLGERHAGRRAGLLAYPDELSLVVGRGELWEHRVEQLGVEHGDGEEVCDERERIDAEAEPEDAQHAVAARGGEGRL
jgi:hypothetical protein